MSLDGAIRSRITLNTYGYDGSVNTHHHEALDAGRDDEAVGRMLEVMQEVAEEERLAVLLQAEHRVELGGRLVGHASCAGNRRTPTAPPCRRGSRRGWPRTAARARRDRSAARRRTGARPRARLIATTNGYVVRAVDDAADDVRGLVAEQQARQHLDLEIRVDDERPRQPSAHRRQHVASGRARKSSKRGVERQVEDEVDQRRAQGRAGAGSSSDTTARRRRGTRSRRPAGRTGSDCGSTSGAAASTRRC